MAGAGENPVVRKDGEKMKILMICLSLVLALLVIVTVSDGLDGASAQPAPVGKENTDKEKPAEWEEMITREYAKEKNDVDGVARFDRRPGRIGAVAAALDHLEGQLALRPELRNALFPYQEDGRVIESAEEFEKQVAKMEADAKAAGKRPVNKLRRTVLDPEGVILHVVPENAGEFDPGPVKSAGSDGNKKLVKDVCIRLRARYPKADTVLVGLDVTYLSLQSKKIEKDGDGKGEDFTFYTVQIDGRYRVAGYQK